MPAITPHHVPVSGSTTSIVKENDVESLSSSTKISSAGDSKLSGKDDEACQNSYDTLQGTPTTTMTRSEDGISGFSISIRSDPKQSELKLIASKRSSALSSRTTQQVLSELTINKFDMKSVGLIGRDAEIATLKSCLERVMTAPSDKNEARQGTQTTKTSQGHKELVFIKGLSGAGKSSLAKTLENDINRKGQGGAFVEGKFDLTSSDAPYSGIAAAFGAICQFVLDKNNEVSAASTSIAESIVSSLGEEVQLLIHLIPELRDVVASYMDTSEMTAQDVDIEYGTERWKYAFRTLTRVFNSHVSPLVLVLDDLQWADVSSLEVMDYLISDVQNPNQLLVIGCYRSNEVDENSILYNRIQTLKGKQAKSGFSITEIEVGGCKVEDVNKIIMKMLSIDDDATTRDLAEVCFKRTLGNPFFLIQFMTMLQSEELLTYNLGLLKWVWDVVKIETATMSAANVVELLQSRLRKLPLQAQLFLKYAACLGSSFNLSSLQLVWEKHAVRRGRAEVTDTVEKLLALVLGERILEEAGVNKYRWVHDKVQEAALSQDELDDEANASFQFEIGEALYYSLDQEELQEELFTVVDLINKQCDTKRAEFAQLNLTAAEKAQSISAFQSSAKYVANGIGHLPPNGMWTANRSSTLRLYTLGAELEFALGHVETAESYSNEVLNREDCSTMESLPLKIAKIRKVCVYDSRFTETVNLSLDLLNELGCKLVWNTTMMPMQAIATFMRTIKMAKKAPAPQDFYTTLGAMEDPKQQKIMAILSRLCFAAYNDDNMFLNLLGCCKMVQMTLKYGVSDGSAPVFAGLGSLVSAVQQDYATATTFAEMGLAMQSYRRTPRASETIGIAYMFVLPWTQPLQSCLSPLEDGYSSAMRVGYTEWGMNCLVANRILIPYMMGRRLNSILEEYSEILSQLEELKLSDQILSLKMWSQMILNLTNHPTTGTGEAHELEGEIFSSKSFTGKNVIHVATIHFLEGELLLFADYQAAAQRAIKGGDKFVKLFPGMMSGMIETFHRAIALYVLARQTGKRKYRTQANRLRKTIEKWHNGGNPNVVHYHYLLSAENAALTNKHAVAEEMYKKATAMAARTGHLHHAGLCNERYADFLLHQLSNEEEAKYYLAEAIRYYEEWGATGKVASLKNKFNL